MPYLIIDKTRSKHRHELRFSEKRKDTHNFTGVGVSIDYVDA